MKKENDPLAINRKHAVEWTVQSGQIYEHYMECRAVNCWPMVDDEVDPIVKRHARLLAECEERMGRADAGAQSNDLIALFSLMIRRR